MANIRPLPVHLALKAQNELNEVPERIEEDLNALKTWIRQQPHLRARTDDQFLVGFLRGCKYSLERVKKKLDIYYSFRTNLPDLIMNSDPLLEKNKLFLKQGVGLRLPNTITPDGACILLIRPERYDPAKVDIIDIFRYIVMVFDIFIIDNDQWTVSGVLEVIDLANVTMAHILQFTPIYIKKLSVICQDAMPLRLKGVHCINAPPGFDTVFNSFKRFLSEKNRNRIYIHGDLGNLYKHIPQKLLPTEYGGEGGSIKDLTTCWENKFLEYRDYLMEESKYGTDEKKRPGRPKTEETLFGIDGSFRKLSVD
ncbi:alpha-tocopherol transfer protein-like [Sergentomyia squamirostris]